MLTVSVREMLYISTNVRLKSFKNEDATSIRPVPAQCWHIKACLEGSEAWNNVLPLQWGGHSSYAAQLGSFARPLSGGDVVLMATQSRGNDH